MRLKQFSAALVMTIFFLCLPITQAISYDEVNNRFERISAISSFKVKLTEEQFHSFHDFIDKIPSVEDQNIAKDIAGQIVSNDNDIDIDRFGEILREYGFENISSYQETTDVVDDVLNFIMELLIDRLGWVYDFLEKTSNVLNDAQRLWADKSLPKELLTAIELLIVNLKELQNLATLLTEGKYGEFLRAWSLGIIIKDVKEIIQSIEIIASDFGILIGDLSRFISHVSNFINWLNENPWEQPIHVYGKVMVSTKGLSNVTIRCRGMTSITDVAGNFSFYVNSTPDEYSIPPNEYYGIHQCVIIAENNGTLKETPVEFSYVFSDGGIYWLFLMDDNSVNNGNIQNVPFHRMGLWSWFCSKTIINLFHRWHH